MKLFRLTDRSLKAIKPTGRRFEIATGGAYPGLILRVSTTGEITFWYRFQIDGVRRKMPVGRYPAESLHELLEHYNSLVAKVKRGIDPLQESTQKNEDRPRFNDFAERFILNHCQKKLSPSTAREYERQLRKYLIPTWDQRRLDSIRTQHIVALIEDLANTSPIMANRVLATSKKLFAYATEVAVLKTNPATGIKPPAKERAKTRVLSLTELSTLFKTLGKQPKRDLSDILRLIALTGQRPGEILSLRLSQLTEESGDLWLTLDAADTKNHCANRIYLNSMARQIIEARIADLSLTNYVFPARTETGHQRKDVLSNWTRKLQPLEGVNYFTPHDLRRSAATGLARLGHGAVVPEILNHSQQGITRQVYDLYTRGPEIRRALTAWGEFLQRAIDETDKGKVIPLKESAAQIM
jgi:integrase